MSINGIMACCKNKGIGKENKLPWNLKEDLNRFKKLTTGSGNNCIIMGRKTWDSINFLKGRDHLILSKNINVEYKNGNNIIKSFSTINEVIKYVNERKYEQSWVIGGENILKQFLELNLIDRLHLTFINEYYDCDVFLPKIPSNYFSTQNQLLSETSESGKEVFLIIFHRAKIGMKVKYNYNIWTIVMLHFEDYPNIYFTIKDNQGNEKQTVKEKITLIL